MGKNEESGGIMAQFRIKIAGAVAEVNSLFDSSRDYCRKYLTEETADFSVAVSWEDLAFEQAALLAEALEEGIGALQMGMTFDAVSVCVDDAIAALMELSGKSVSEAVVANVFSKFCVGK